jgi:hypothetical protein
MAAGGHRELPEGPLFRAASGGSEAGELFFGGADLDFVGIAGGFFAVAGSGR